MNSPPFVVSRSDGFVGVEVNTEDQLSPEEAAALGRELLRLSGRALVVASRAWARKVMRVTWSDKDGGYVFWLGKRRVSPAPARGGTRFPWPSSRDLDRFMFRNRVTHVDQSFGGEKADPESPRKGVHTRAQYVAWWKTGEEEEV